MNIPRTLLLGLLALPLAAQSTAFSVGGGVILGLDSYKKAVNNSTGLMLNGAWETTVVKSGIPARVSLPMAATTSAPFHRKPSPDGRNVECSAAALGAAWAERKTVVSRITES